MEVGFNDSMLAGACTTTFVGLGAANWAGSVLRRILYTLLRMRVKVYVYTSLCLKVCDLCRKNNLERCVK